MSDAVLRWIDARAALSLFASDPSGFGGIVVRARSGPVRDAWLEALRTRLPLRKLPPGAEAEVLIGGLDIVATLDARAPVVRQGLLEAANGGALLIPGAERLGAATASLIAAAMDACGAFGVVAFDEGDGDEAVPAALVDRCAFIVDLDGIPVRVSTNADLDALSENVPDDGDDDGEVLETLCEAAALHAIGSSRAPLFALRAIRSGADLESVVRLVLAPRATTFPAPPENALPPDTSDAPQTEREGETADMTDIAIAAAKAALPPGLLAALAIGKAVQPVAGKAGAAMKAKNRGRPAGVRAGVPRGGARLSLIDTLRAAAPWQRLRGAEAGRVAVRGSDLRIKRFAARAEATSIFVVDASGSAALERLAEAKGAVELLLADAYVARTQVALVSFRGSGADVLLPPTRSLARAKRCLADMNGGGGTPLGAGIAAGTLLADAARRAGRTPMLVLMTDGRGNVASGAASAREESLAAARQVRAGGIGAVLIDIGARPRAEAADLAAAMGARYVALPRARAETLRDAVSG